MRLTVGALLKGLPFAGRMVIETLGHLHWLGLAAAVCVAVRVAFRVVFAEDAYDQLLKAGAARASTASIAHPTNAMSIAGLLADACAGPPWRTVHPEA